MKTNRWLPLILRVALLLGLLFAPLSQPALAQGLVAEYGFAAVSAASPFPASASPFTASPSAASSSTVPVATSLGDSVALLIDAQAKEALALLRAQNATPLEDYGAFSLWQTSATQAETLRALPGVTVRAEFSTIPLRGDAIIHTDTSTGELPLPAHLRQAASSGPELWMIQFVGPIKDEWLAAVRQVGLEVVVYMANNAYVVWGEAAHEKVAQLATANPFVQWTGAYHPGYRLAPTLQTIAATQPMESLVDVTVQFYRTPTVEASLKRLLGLGEAVYKSPEDILVFTNITLQLPAGKLAEVAAWPDVFNVEPWSAPVKLDEIQDQILVGNVISSGGAIVPSGPGYLAWLTAYSFSITPTNYPVVDIVDDGIDQGDASNVLHPDFHELGLAGNPDRVVYIQRCTTDPTGNGQDGHGNINAGIVGSYNNLSGSPHVDANGYRIGLGVSPYGRIAGTKIFNNSGSYDVSNCGNTDAGVVAASFVAGANFTSNSWGAPVGGAYDSSSQAYDALTRDAHSPTGGNQEMLHIFAAGNDGPGANSIGSPGTAKNVLTVAATENVRDEGIADGCGLSAANNADDLATFSSRGPTDDQRVKPEISGPGTHIQGPASKDPGYTGNGVCGPIYYPAVGGNVTYTWSSGTSHSTPAIAGLASLTWEYYGRVLNPSQTPSPAMLKALLLVTTRYLNGSSTGGTLPSNTQGWGDGNLGMLTNGTPMVLRDQQDVFASTGQQLTFVYQVVSNTQPLRVALVWTDAPGSTTGNAFVNNLNLEVTAGGGTYNGNVFSGANSTTGGSADPRNNVETVFLPAGVSGPYTVRVTAANIAGDGVPGNGDSTDQDFALIVYNATPISAPVLGVANVEVTGGDGDGVLEPNETANVNVALVNMGNVTATTVSGVMTSPNIQAIILSGSSAYADIDPAATVTNATPFQLRLDAGFVCGDPLTLTLTVSTTQGTFPVVVTVPTLPPPVVYNSTNVPLFIPDNPTISSTLVISDNFTISDLNATINLTHTFDADLDIFLVAPNGTTVVELTTDNGGGGNDYTNTTFDDEAATAITAGTPPFTGSFRPEGSLSVLDGMNAAGTWTLRIDDDLGADTGMLLAWSLSFPGSCDVPPLPTVQFSAPAYSVIENDATGMALITVTLSGTSPVTVTVDFDTSNGTATAGLDYTTTSQQVTIPAGQISQTVNVPIIDDLIFEGPVGETVNLALSNAVNATLGTPIALQLTIQDNEPPPTVQFSSADYSVAESGGTATITASLSRASAFNQFVDYTTSDGTATAGSDYSNANGTLTFLPGVITQTFTVTITDDTFFESDETVNLALTVVNTQLGTPNTATLTIRDAVGVLYGATGGGTASNLLVLDPATGQVAQTIGSIGFAVTGLAIDPTTGILYGVTSRNSPTAPLSLITIDRTTGAGILVGPSGSFGNNGPVADLSFDASGTLYGWCEGINFDTDDLCMINLTTGTATLVGPSGLSTFGSGLAFSPSGTLYFAGDGSSGDFYTVNPATGLPTVVATLSGAPAPGGPISALAFDGGGTLYGVNPDFGGNPAYLIRINPTTGVITSMGQSINRLDAIVFDQPRVAFSGAAFNGNEQLGGSTATITATLSITLPFPVTVNYTTSDGTATAGSDYTATSNTLTFNPGDTSETFLVNISDDALFEGNETVTLTLSNPGNAALGTPNPATLNIADDEITTAVQFSAASYNRSEAGGSATITATLTSPPAFTVRVDYATSDGTALAGSDYTTATSTLIFNPGITTQTFSVLITNDAIYEGDEMLNLTLSNVISANYGSPLNAVLVILEDDLPPTIQFSAPGYNVGEAAGAATITATLTGATAVTATVDFTTIDAGAVASSDYIAASGTLTFAPGTPSLTFTVPITNDVIFEGNETVILQLSNPVSATLGADDQATLTIVDNETQPTVQFSAPGYNIDENAGPATITATLSTASAFTATVVFATSDGTALAGSDYTPITNTLTFTPGITALTVTVPITNDLIFEGNETVSLTLSNPSNTSLGAPNPAILTIVNDDPVPSLQFSSGAYSVNETDSTITITVILSSESAFTVTVDLANTGGTATEGSDYVFPSGPLTFAPGQTSRTFTVVINDDATFEGDETVIMELSNPVGAGLGATALATLTIVDDETQPTVRLSSSAYNVAENAGPAVITATLSGASAFTATVNLDTSDGTALAGIDYIAANVTLTFTPGLTTTTFPVSILDDAIFENNETVNLTLSNPVNTTLGTPDTATLTILNDEPSPTVQFSALGYSVGETDGTTTITATLSVASAFTATVDFATSGGTATAGSDYLTVPGTLTFTPGVTLTTFIVTINDDDVYEGDETIIMELSNPVNTALGSSPLATLTIVENEVQPTVQFSSGAYSVNEPASPATITATLSGASAFTVTVDFATSDGTALAGSDYLTATRTLTFTPGLTTTTVLVPILDDAVFENDETVNLALSNPSNTSLGAPNTASLTIVSDELQPTLQFSNGAYSVNEADGAATITVTLSGASAFVATVDYTTNDNTATAGSDYVTSTGTLTFIPGATVVTFTVPITNDTVFENDEAVILSLSNPNGAPLGAPFLAGLTIVDDEAPPAVRFGGAAFNGGEQSGGDTATITVTLSGASVFTTTVDFATSNGTATAGSDYTAIANTLTFTPGVIAQTFNVNILDDALPEGNETVTLTLSNPVSATLGIPNPATLNIADDEITATVQFSAASYSVNETGGSATITATLSAASGITATVDFATSDGTALAGSDYTAASGTLTFAPGVTTQTFTVPILDNAIYEGDETLNLALSNVISANFGSPLNAVLVIVEDDPIPTIQFSAAGYNVGENAGPATITATLSAASGITATVDFATSDGTATVGNDYTTSSGTLTFAPGVITQTFTVPITDDLIFEGNETVNLALSSSVSATLGTTNTATLTIVENEPPPNVQFSAPGYSVDESAGPATITATLSPASIVTVTVVFTTSNGTALAGSDYTAITNTLTFTPGVTNTIFNVPITDDLIFEGNETVNLALSNAINALLGAPITATLTITNDEPQPTVQFSAAAYSVAENAGPATITATLSGTSAFTTTVDFATSDGTALVGSDYTAATGTLTFAPGVTATTFSVSITDDLTFEGNETVNLALSNPVSATLGAPVSATLTITDDETQPTVQLSSDTYSVDEPAGPATITATLSWASAFTITVNFATSNGTATAGSDYTTASGTLTFAPGVTAQTFTVPILDDALFEDNETVNLALSNAVSATLGTTNTATLTIMDNDPLTPTVQFSAAAYSVDENAGPATITATLSAASGVTVTANFATSNGTALAGSDYTAASGTLTFAPGVTAQTFTVPILDDTLFEGNETVNLTLSNPVSATLGTPNTATLTIVDNDPLTPTVQFSAATYSVSEAGGTATITVSLNTTSGVTATVNFATSNSTATAGSDYTAASGTLTFAPGVTTTTFTVLITNDALFESDETVNLVLSNPASATLGTPSTAMLTIVDNDYGLYLPLIRRSVIVLPPLTINKMKRLNT